jgi:hypothetical protein
MDRADGVTYPDGLTGVPRVILWVTFGFHGGLLFNSKKKMIEAILTTF